MRDLRANSGGRSETTTYLHERICDTQIPHLIWGSVVVLLRCQAHLAGTFFMPRVL